MRGIALALALTLALLAACNPCRQAQRSLAKCPEAARDTVIEYIEHTHILPADTIERVFSFWDTLVVNNDRLRLEVRVDTVTQRVHVRGGCKSDTVRLTLPQKTITKTKLVPARNKWWQPLSFGLLLGLVAALILFFHFRK